MISDFPSGSAKHFNGVACLRGGEGGEGASFVFVSGLQRTVDRAQCQLIEEELGETYSEFRLLRLVIFHVTVSRIIYRVTHLVGENLLLTQI